MVETDPAALGEFCETANHSLFRLEVLAHYDVSSDGGDFQRYIDGEDGPDPEMQAAWHKVLQSDLDRGVTTSRVHVVRSPLSPYLRYEFEWGYAHNIAYENIGIIDTAEQPLPAELEEVGDFWLVDGERVGVMHYDTAGRYLGFEEVSSGDALRYLAAEDAAIRAAVSFEHYMATHRIGRHVA